MTALDIQNTIELPYTDEASELKSSMYTLKSCVVHAGTNASWGHYYCLEINHKHEKLIIYNDAQVTYQDLTASVDNSDNYINKL